MAATLNANHFLRHYIVEIVRCRKQVVKRVDRLCRIVLTHCRFLKEKKKIIAL